MIAKILIGAVAALHVYILVLEMFLWTRPRTLRSFGVTQEYASITRTMAANQGLYNGFLAAGLIWSLLAADVAFARQLVIFFLGCVIVAAIYGAATVNREIIFKQGAPAVLAMLAVFFA